ncbi:hypothetical protein [Winogradskya humida]|uniref:WD40 repeat protein n=1 Tax=Winogradskya humida TaxID=113566 RepID=A0ABQ3ZNJ1_9ACTN|nr:hypothetical protein [Actinoplanes humidus]GIE20112.1 hypothetical protein Ahu01nite_032140 [Actinoplanes humidus]
MNDLLRQAIREMADETRPAGDLAAGAMARGRQLRRRRRAAVGAAVALLVLITFIPYAVLRETHRQETPAVEPTPTPTIGHPPWSPDKPFGLPGGWMVTGLAGDTDAVFDTETRKYRLLEKDFTGIWVSPDARYAAVTDDVRPYIGIIDLRTQRLTWTTVGFVLEPQWSSDSASLLLTGTDRFTVITAATGKVRRHPLDERFSCVDYCLYTWLPGNKEVALAKVGVNGSETNGPTVSALTVLDATTGEWTRDLAVPGVPPGQDAWSPDGTTVIVRGDGKQPDLLRIADVTTGKVRTQLATTRAFFISDDRIIGFENGTAVLMDLDGRAIAKQDFPEELTDLSLSYGPGK